MRVRLVLRSPLAVGLYAVLGGLATLAVLLAARGRAMLPEGNAWLALLALGVGQGVRVDPSRLPGGRHPLRRWPGGADDTRGRGSASGRTIDGLTVARGRRSLLSATDVTTVQGWMPS